jgi:hypothetical protein
MPDYTVTWTTQVQAEDHADAARVAREVQLDPDSIALVFEVEGAPIRTPHGTTRDVREIDLTPEGQR